MTPTLETRKRYLASVLNNFAAEGFDYRSVNDGEETHHGLAVDAVIDLVFDLEVANITVTNVPSRTRKIGMLLVLDSPDQAPMDMIADYGAANEDDMAIADRCIEGGTSA